jgi:hypothetical protein
MLNSSATASLPEALVARLKELEKLPGVRVNRIPALTTPVTHREIFDAAGDNVPRLEQYHRDSPEWDVDALAALERENSLGAGADVIDPNYTRALVHLSRVGFYGADCGLQTIEVVIAAVRRRYVSSRSCTSRPNQYHSLCRRHGCRLHHHDVARGPVNSSHRRLRRGAGEPLQLRRTAAHPPGSAPLPRGPGL